MFAAIFSSAMFVMTLYCAFMVFSAWRNPENWHIDGDTKQIVFHAWLDIGIFAAMGTVCILALMMGLFF